MNLSNLHISGSYLGLINLEDSTQPLPSQSGDINLQDGKGNNLGLQINAQTNKFTIVNDLKVDGDADFNGNVDISGSLTFTGSLDVNGNLTAHTGSFDTVNTRVLHVLVESASVILSSGSNQIGDDITDTQTIIGVTTISGSLGVTGTQSNTGSLFVSNEISSSTINGIGNVTSYSASVDSRLDNAEWTGSNHETRIIALEQFTSSQESINSGYNAFTQSYYVDSASFDTRITDLENFSSSLVADFVTDVEYSQSIAVVTASLESQINTKLNSSWTSSVFTPFSSSVSSEQILQDSKLTSLISATGSYARLDIDNTFENNNFFSGSVRGAVYNIIPVSNTASIDCSQGNFFTLLQATSNDYLLNATNITGGRTITLRVKKTNPSGTISIDTGSIKFPSGFSYSITSGDEKEDILTFVSFDTGSLYGVASKNFV